MRDECLIPAALSILFLMAAAAEMYCGVLFFLWREFAYANAFFFLAGVFSIISFVAMRHALKELLA